MKSVIRFNFGSLAPVLFLMSASAVAQSTGTLHGLVRDPSGAVVPGANVVLTNSATQQQTRTVTTAAGTYAFAFLPPGEYTVAVDHAGFSRFVQAKIPVD